jgi:HEAT repeat protein
MSFSLGRAALLAGLVCASAGAVATGRLGVQDAKPFPVKVFLFTRSSLIELDANGLAEVRRGSLEPSQLEVIQGAIRDFSAQVRQVSGGTLEPRVSVEEDSDQAAALVAAGQTLGTAGDLAVRLGAAPSGSNWSQLLAKGVGARANSAPFDANDRQYRGPYEAVFVIHAGLDGIDRDFSFDGMPGRVIGWHTFSMDEPKAALTQELLAAASRLSGKFAWAPPSAPSRFPSAYGEAEIAVTGPAIRLTSTGVVARGGARLSALKIFEAPIVSFKAKSATREPMALNLMGSKGPIGSILLKGHRPGQEDLLLAPHDPAGARLEAGTEWTSFTLDLRQVPGWEGAEELHMGTPLSVGRFEKGPPEHSILEITDLAFSAPTSEGVLTLKAPSSMADEAALREAVKKARSEEALSTEDWAKLSQWAATGSSREKLSVLCAFLVRKDPKAVPLLLAAATSASIVDAFAATRALAAQGSPEGRAALSEVLQKGPFDINRRFAAEVLPDVAPIDLPMLNMMMLQRAWRGRLAAVEAISRLKTRDAQVILTTSLAFEAEPNPLVRLAIANSLDSTFELAARRLLVSGLNDPSNWVRAASLVRLLDSPFETIRQEAARGVRDDAPPVRMALLEAMKAKPSAGFRSALRLAVTDGVPEVRAAAIDALAVQEGPIQSQEVENTFTDSSAPVQLSLVRAAVKGKISLPPAVRDALKASAHPEVRTAAQGL